MNVRLHVCNSCMLTMFALMNFETYTVNASVSMSFLPIITRLRKDINIACTVHDIDVINSKVSRQWSKGTDLICYNGHPVDSNKYTEILNSRNQFTLQIKNVVESDFNNYYECRYGFNAVIRNLKLSKDNFEYPPADQVRAVVSRNNLDQTFSINLNFTKIFPVPRCIARFGSSSLSFNITSNTTHGIFYEMNLRLISTDKLQCDKDISVECELISLYHIPTEDIKKCKIDYKSFKISVYILCIIFVLTCTVMVCVVSCGIKKQENGRNISIYRSFMDESKSFIRRLFTKSNVASDESLHEIEICTLNERDPKDDENDINLTLLTESTLDPKDDENDINLTLLTENEETLDPKDDKDSINSSQLTETKEKVSGNDQLQRGDAISFRRNIGLLKYEHHGIVEKVIPETTRFKIIHVTGTSTDLVASISSNLTTGICSQVIDFETDNDVYKYTFTCRRQDGKNPADVAEMFLEYGFPEELGFHILHFNCESFSRYCATGVVYSKQTRHRNEAAQIKLDVLVRQKSRIKVN